jgi:hypothetical protein
MIDRLDAIKILSMQSRRSAKLLRFCRFSKILWLIPAAIFILSAYASAFEPQFKYIKRANGEIKTSMALSDSLPEDLINNINKGVPVLFTYRIELWIQRAGWFDKLFGRIETTYKVRYDPWEKRYSVIQIQGDLTIEHSLKGEREVWEIISSSGEIAFAPENIDGYCYMAGEMSAKVMSFSNYKEVESWLKGEITDAGSQKLSEAPDKVGEFMFDMALKISGFKNMSKSIKSENFEIAKLPVLEK